MTGWQAIEQLDDSLAVWSSQACEDKPNAEPFEVEAIRAARRALDVLRRLALEDERRWAA